MSTRTELADLITPLLPEQWSWVLSERNIDAQNNMVVRLTQQRIERHPASPKSKLLVTFNLQVLAPGLDMDRAEEYLDEAVGLLLLVLPNLPQVVWWDGTATKVFSPESHLSYDIPLAVTVTLPTPEPTN